MSFNCFKNVELVRICKYCTNFVFLTSDIKGFLALIKCMRIVCLKSAALPAEVLRGIVMFAILFTITFTMRATPRMEGKSV